MAWFNKPMLVVGFLATRRDDEDRGPLVRMSGEDAAMRQLAEGELAWVHGPRRQELATVRVDDTLQRGTVVLRDVAGIAVSEIVRVTKPELDPPSRPPVA